MAMTKDEACFVEDVIINLLSDIDDLKKAVKKQSRKIRRLVLEVESATYAATQSSLLLAEIIGENKFVSDSADNGWGWLWEMKEKTSCVDGEPDFCWNDSCFKYDEIHDELNGVKKIGSRLLDDAAVFLNAGLEADGH